jgi:hypothetical protein
MTPIGILCVRALACGIAAYLAVFSMEAAFSPEAGSEFQKFYTPAHAFVRSVSLAPFETDADGSSLLEQ